LTPGQSKHLLLDLPADLLFTVFDCLPHRRAQWHVVLAYPAILEFVPHLLTELDVECHSCANAGSVCCLAPTLELFHDRSHLPIRVRHVTVTQYGCRHYICKRKHNSSSCLPLNDKPGVTNKLTKLAKKNEARPRSKIYDSHAPGCH
jgi:hypothetical protein